MRNSTITFVIAALVVLFLAILVLALFFTGVKLVDALTSANFNMSFPIITFPDLNITLPALPGVDTVVPQPPPARQMPEDMRKYYEMKNLSCDTLKGDFLIVTEDVSAGYFHGIIPDTPEERAAAESMLAPYGFNQTTRTYVRGERMKKVVTDTGGQATTIWKDGRIYNCLPGSNCTMRVFTEEDSEAYYSALNGMKSGCAYFGRTQLPQYVDMARLIKIRNAGPKDTRGFSCMDFMITGNSTYARSLLSSPGLSDDQKALLWGIAHFSGPVEECLDEATGIIVLRNLTIDLSDTYRFDYAPGGYMEAGQQTWLTYFTDNVPESFLALPE